MSIKISSRKAKARKLQQWVAEQLSNITGIPWGKDLDIESREMGQSGTDVKIRGEAKKYIPFDIECKSTERITLYADIKQAKSNTCDGNMWLLIHKKKYHDPIVIMDANDFFNRIWQRTLHITSTKGEN